MGVTYAYAAEIVKAERDAAGDLIVYGKATGPDLDLDGQIADPGWLKSAMPAWMEWGNVREMHQPIAAGIGVELEAIGDDWWLKSKCIDPGTAQKIEAGALKGYSIGIKNAKVIKDASAPAGRIVGGTIVETSYVDRPCNPTAKMTICKRASGDAELAPVDAPDGTESDAESEVSDATLISGKPVAVGEPDPASGEGQGEGRAVERAAKAASGNRLALSLAAQVRRLVPSVGDLDKAAPAQDIADAQSAIAAVARLIMSEAESLAAGEMADAYQISILLDAICALKWFVECEAGEASDSMDTMPVIELAAGGDGDTKDLITKSAPSDSGEGGSGGNITEQIDKAIAKAREADVQRIEALEAELTKALRQPVPGGPVLARPLSGIADAQQRGDALTKAARYERLAVEMRSIDPDAAAGYDKMAADARASVAA